jgi:hypothetical protein
VIVQLVLHAHSSSTSATTVSVHINPLYTHKATKFIGPDTSNFISHSARNTEVAQVTGVSDIDTISYILKLSVIAPSFFSDAYKAS